jgi:hypothetical protein
MAFSVPEELTSVSLLTLGARAGLAPEVVAAPRDAAESS